MSYPSFFKEPDEIEISKFTATVTLKVYIPLYDTDSSNAKNTADDIAWDIQSYLQRMKCDSIQDGDEIEIDIDDIDIKEEESEE